jgi:hypothetical protein
LARVRLMDSTAPRESYLVSASIGISQMAAKLTANKMGVEKTAANEPVGFETDGTPARARQTAKKRPALKVRHEPPTLEDAIYAAQGLTEDVGQQIEFAADLMHMPAEELRPQLLRAVSKPTSNRVFVPARSGMQRAVVIETTGRPRARKPSAGPVGAP